MPPEREWLEKDFYAVLGVQPAALPREIAKAYRDLAKRYHPDANPGSEERFKEITAAYDVLGDEKRRAEYDRVRQAAANPFSRFARRPAGSGASSRPSAGGADFGDILSGIFGGGRRGGAAPQRGADVDASITLSFQDAITGTTTAVEVPGEVRCTTCGGTGAAPGSSPSMCRACMGKGVLEDDQGLFSLSRICAECGGRGTKVDHPCRDCRGTGRQVRMRSVKVRIPPGVDDAQRIRIRGRGAAGANGGEPGDLFVTVSVRPHVLFTRKGQDLSLAVPVTFAEAALGTEVTVPTLDEPVTVRVPAGTSSGQVFRVRGRGVPAHGSAPAGDLLVMTQVEVPKQLTAEQRAAVEALAAVSEPAPRAFLRVPVR